MDACLALLRTRGQTPLVAPSEHTQAPLASASSSASAPSPFPDLLGLARSRARADFRIAHALTLLSALAPDRVAEALRPAFGDVERRRLLAGDTLPTEYAALGLHRKKKFTLDDLRALVADPSRERDAWAAGDLDALAPLLAFVGRRLGAEVEANGVGYHDLAARRPRRLCTTWADGRLSASLA